MKMDYRDIPNDILRLIAQNMSWDSIITFPQRDMMLDSLTIGQKRMLRVQWEYQNGYIPPNRSHKWWMCTGDGSNYTYIRGEVVNIKSIPHLKYLTAGGVYHSEDQPSICLVSTRSVIQVWFTMGVLHRDSDHTKWNKNYNGPAYMHYNRHDRRTIRAWVTNGTCTYALCSVTGHDDYIIPNDHASSIIVDTLRHNVMLAPTTEMITDGCYTQYAYGMADEHIDSDGMTTHYRCGIKL